MQLVREQDTEGRRREGGRGKETAPPPWKKGVRHHAQPERAQTAGDTIPARPPETVNNFCPLFVHPSGAGGKVLEEGFQGKQTQVVRLFSVV